MSSSVPQDVYVDTNVLVNYIFGGLPDSAACANAIQEIAESESIVFTSVITRMEFAQAVRSLATRRQLPRHIYEDFNLNEWADRQVRRTWMMHWLQEFERFLAAMPAVAELPLSPDIINTGVEIMARYGLRSHDAVHVATASMRGINTFWTCDSHFDRVDIIAVTIIRDPR